ncbi:amine oxidase [Mycena rebaudengoi]|nr:amine oxidase [Mycena rebaudengoi]
MHAIPLLLVPFQLALAFSGAYGTTVPRNQHAAKPKVLVLGGGVSGIIAARTLHRQGIDFQIIEARDELGGRMKSHTFANQTVEAGANWVQGTQQGEGPANPIFELAKKHNTKTQFNDYFGSVTTFDAAGQVDFLDIFNRSIDDYVELTVTGGARVQQMLVDGTSRTGYSMSGAKPRDHHAQAAEYYQFDWEYAQKPDQTSWIASSWANNFTFDADEGGFSEDNLLSIDQRGFKTLIQSEANEFLKPGQVSLSSVVKKISYSANSVEVTLSDGKHVTGDYAICTFSLGVLQNDDVKFEPSLPAYKQEAIQSMTMATYTKIFLKFKEKFWFDTEMGLYADQERGRYPVWQSLDHENFFPGSGIIFVTVTGDYSERIEALSDGQVKEEVLSVLKSMYPHVDIPQPLDFWFPRWHTDPLYRGSYSNWPSSFRSEHHENLRANVDRLFFAGEHSSQKYFGFLHGAYFSGLETGEIVAKCVKGGGCAGLHHVNSVKNPHPYQI